MNQLLRRGRGQKQLEATFTFSDTRHTIRIFVLLKQHLQLMFLLLSPQNNPGAYPLHKKKLLGFTVESANPLTFAKSAPTWVSSAP